jgi:hypothetical protein
MEHSILIGIISSIAISTTLYVYNSNDFNKEQKAILLISIICPPIQWIGILIVLAYNNNKIQNSPEVIIKKEIIEHNIKLDSSIESLKHLKEKGIITNNEFENKIEKLEDKRIEQIIQNSIEYKQLKSLLESNILNPEEFDEKVKMLKNDNILKDIVKRDETIDTKKNITFTKKETVFRETTEGEILKIISEGNKTIGAEVFINNIAAPDGVYNYKSKTHKLIIENGKIKERYFIEITKDFIIEKSNEISIQNGDKLFYKNGQPVPTGKYRTGFMNPMFLVENGEFIRWL